MSNIPRWLVALHTGVLHTICGLYWSLASNIGEYRRARNRLDLEGELADPWEVAYGKERQQGGNTVYGRGVNLR